MPIDKKTLAPKTASVSAARTTYMLKTISGSNLATQSGSQLTAKY
jgi:hypothetical protein